MNLEQLEAMAENAKKMVKSMIAEESEEQTIDSVIRHANSILGLREEPVSVMALIITNRDTKPTGNYISLAFPSKVDRTYRDHVFAYMKAVVNNEGEEGNSCCVCGAEDKPSKPRRGRKHHG